MMYVAALLLVGSLQLLARECVKSIQKQWSGPKFFILYHQQTDMFKFTKSTNVNQLINHIMGTLSFHLHVNIGYWIHNSAICDQNYIKIIAGVCSGLKVQLMPKLQQN